MNEEFKAKALAYHRKNKGKIGMHGKMPLMGKEDLQLAYTPGVAYACLAIKENKEEIDQLTSRQNTVAVITDGSAVLGLGDLGPEASLPVMEGKCVLFKHFGGIDAYPILLDTQDVDKFVETVALISLSFGGINLEDISAPRCFEIERKLKEKTARPIFHDDQHGTAMVVLAGLMNALTIIEKENPKIIISGAGAAAIATARLLYKKGFKDIILCDRRGALYPGRAGQNDAKEQVALLTNPQALQGSLETMMKGRDIFIGLSAPGLVSESMIASMNPEPIIFACSNPVPEIEPSLAQRAGAGIVATGRSDDANQINNVLIFPGFFRGVLDQGIKFIDEEMFIDAAQALASFIPRDQLSREYFIPNVFEEGLAMHIARGIKNR